MTLKERIIDHTTKMFASQGVKSIRMDDIATEMGISKRTLYEIFGDKQNLIMECLGYFNNKIREYYEQITQGAGNIIEEYLMFLNVWDKQMDATYNIMNDVKKFYPRLYEKYTADHRHEAIEQLKAKLQQGIEQGYLLENINLPLSITVMGYSLYGIIKKDAILPDNISERDAFKYVVSYFMRGMATLKGIEMIDEYFGNNKQTDKDQ